MSLEEFADHLSLPTSKFVSIVFGLLDEDKSGQLDFRGTVHGPLAACVIQACAVPLFDMRVPTSARLHPQQCIVCVCLCVSAQSVVSAFVPCVLVSGV